MAYWWLDACAAPDEAAAESARVACERDGLDAASTAVRVALAALQGTPTPTLERVQASVFAGDHGIAAAAATGATLAQFAAGGPTSDVAGLRRDAVNLGVLDDDGPVPGITREVIAAGTADFRVHPGMNAEQALRAIAAGAASIERARAAGMRLVIAAAIGNAETTSARALVCRLLGITPQALCADAGPDAALADEFAVIAQGLARHVGAVDALACLRRLGGFGTAALAGACVAGAQAGIPVLVDGLAGVVAAMVAVGLNPGCRPWVLLAHAGSEPGFARAAAAVHLAPLVAGTALEGTLPPALAALPAMRSACAPS